jgi:hypothetical protein
MKANTMVKAVAGLVLAGFVGGSLPVMASPTAEQTMSITVDSINEISVSGAVTLHITTATPGQAPTPVTDATTTYSITTNQGGMKITARIDSAMPSGMALNLTATATTGGSSTGKKSLTTADQDVVTGVGQVSETKALSYELTATAAAGTLAATTRTVTFTITQ